MSLGMLGEYGSHSSRSEISDSDSELEPTSNGRTKRHQSLVHQDAVTDRTKSHQSLADLDAVADSSHTETCNGPKSGTVSDPLDYAQGDTSSSDEEHSKEYDGSPEEKGPSISLPLPHLDQLTSQTGMTSSSSVFSNPFKERKRLN